MQAQTERNVSAPEQQAPRRHGATGFSSRIGWTMFGFILGVGVWHAVGFWSFVTAVTLTGHAPERASITSAVLGADAPKTNPRINPPQPTRARPPKQARAVVAPETGTAERPGETQTSKPPATEPPDVAATTPAAAPSTEAVNPVVIASPTESTDRPGDRADPAPSARAEAPTPTRTAERSEPTPPPQQQPSAPPAWATRIITGTLD